ncbi:MAG: KH domain-containing protein [bacterium]|nr:KH domain-containing protein [bacterium]
MKDLVNFIVSGIVEKPDKIEISENSENEEIILKLKVDPGDMGKVIGKNGQTIRAIRTLIRTCAFRKNLKVRLLLEESENLDPKN